MRRLIFAVVLLAFAIVAYRADATSNRSYKPNEYVAIQGGYAPDKRFSITAHGEGEYGYDNFHLYLMAEPGHRKIGPLVEVGPEILDTGPDAYRAKWSADSQHVAIFYRSDRHILAMRFYRMASRRAYPVTGPTLFDMAGGSKLPQETEITASSVEFRWVNRVRFMMQERVTLRTRTPDLVHALGDFGKLEQQTEQNKSDGLYFVDFSAEAEGELISRDRYRILNMKPAAFIQ